MTDVRQLSNSELSQLRRHQGERFRIEVEVYLESVGNMASRVMLEEWDGGLTTFSVPSYQLIDTTVSGEDQSDTGEPEDEG